MMKMKIIIFNITYIIYIYINNILYFSLFLNNYILFLIKIFVTQRVFYFSLWYINKIREIFFS